MMGSKKASKSGFSYLLAQMLRGKWLTNAATSAIILGAIILTAGGLGLAVLFILNPDAPAIVNRFLPPGMQFPFNPSGLQTLERIEAEIGREGYKQGEILTMEGSDRSSLLIPLLKNGTGCEPACQEISEFRLYQPSSLANYYEIGQQVKIVGPDEAFVLAPLPQEAEQYKDSYRALSLTKVTRLESQIPGVWLNLTGDRTFGTTSLLYGTVFHYNPKTDRLQKIVEWTSPAAESIYWEQVISDPAPELVVNQAVGIEPVFQVYRVTYRDSGASAIALTQVSLKTPAIPRANYQKALQLAKAGLWINALEKLGKEKLPAKTAPQVSLIRLHANFAESQLKQAWASPNQQLLVYLINGRWKPALELFDTSLWERAGILRTIRNDSGRLMRRIETYLQIDPGNLEAKAWGAIAITAQDGKEEAITWLESRSQTSPEDRKKITDLIEVVNKAIAPAES
jgi:hypothetical protein